MVHHVERMKNDRIAKRVYIWECAGSLQNRLIDTVKDYLKKRGLNVRHGRRMVHGGGMCGDITQGMYP